MESKAAAELTVGMSQAALDSQFSNQIINAYAKKLTTDEYSQNLNDYATELDAGKGTNNQLRKLLEENNVKNITGDKLTDLQTLYEKLGGSLEGLDDEVKNSSKEMAKLVAGMVKGANEIAGVEKVIANLETISKKGTDKKQSKSNANIVSALLSNDLSGLTQEEINSLVSGDLGGNINKNQVIAELKRRGIGQDVIDAILEGLDFSAINAQRNDLTEKFTSYITDAFSGPRAEEAQNAIRDATTGRTFNEVQQITDFYP